MALQIDEIKKRLWSIPWSKIEKPEYSSDIEQVIEELLVRTGEEQLEGSFWNLTSSICRNHELHESAFYIIPILIELLKVVRPQVNAVILEVIDEILLSWAPLEMTIRLGFPSERHGVFDDKMIWEVPLQIACRNSIAMGIPIYLELLRTEKDVKCRKMITCILAEFPEFELEIAPILKQILKHEPNEEVRDAIKEAINDLKR